MPAGETTVDPGLEATGPASAFYDTFAKAPTANYVPSGARRNVGTGVAVQEPPLTADFAKFGLGDVPSLYRNLLGREASPEELASHQAFGPTIDAEEIDTFLRGTQGGDLPTAQSALDYFRRTNDKAGTQAILDASARGGPLTRDILGLMRPDAESRISGALADLEQRQMDMRPIYRSSYQDYAPTTAAEPKSFFSAGFNPFSYASPPSAQRLGEIRSAMAPYLTAAPATGPTAGFDAYTGYNPFTPGAVNPYATRMARPTVPPTLPGPEQPAVQSPTVQQNLTNPFSRSVGEGVAVDFGPSTLRQPAPTSFPYLSSYLRAYAKGGGVGIE